MTVVAANNRPQQLHRSSESVSYLTRILSSSSISWRGQTGCRHSLSPCWWAAEACGLVTTAGWALLGCIQCPGPHWASLWTCVCWSSWTDTTWSPEESGRADPAVACWVEGETDQTRSYSKCRVVLQQHRRERFVSDLASSGEEPLSARHIDAATSGVAAQILPPKRKSYYFVTSILSTRIDTMVILTSYSVTLCTLKFINPVRSRWEAWWVESAVSSISFIHEDIMMTNRNTLDIRLHLHIYNSIKLCFEK